MKWLTKEVYEGRLRDDAGSDAWQDALQAYHDTLGRLGRGSPELRKITALNLAGAVLISAHECFGVDEIDRPTGLLVLTLKVPGGRLSLIYTLTQPATLWALPVGSTILCDELTREDTLYHRVLWLVPTSGAGAAPEHCETVVGFGGVSLIFG